MAAAVACVNLIILGNSVQGRRYGRCYFNQSCNNIQRNTEIVNLMTKFLLAIWSNTYISVGRTTKTKTQEEQNDSVINPFGVIAGIVTKMFLQQAQELTKIKEEVLEEIQRQHKPSFGHLYRITFLLGMRNGGHLQCG